MKEPFHEPTMRGHSGSRYYEGRKIFGGRFLLQKRIGRGGMGEVWLAQDAELSQSRAIKFLPPEIASDQRAVGQLRREARAGMELAHPRIVRTNDFYSEDDDAAVVMEYVEGQTMSAAQSEKDAGFLEVGEIQGWVEDVVQALRYAHGEMGRVHRDIKPQNVMVEKKTGRAKLMDFGISRRISDTHTMLTGADAAGTLAYSSPQQILGESPSAADDIYSLGATVYDLLTGTPPFFRGDLRTQVAKSIPPPMAERRKELQQAGMIGGEGEEIPEAWEHLVAACLSKDLAKRPPTMDEFEALMEGKAKAAAPPTLPPAAKARAVPEPAPRPAPQPAPQPVVPKPPPQQVEPQTVAAPAPAPQTRPAAPRKSNTGLKVLVGLLVLLVAGLGGYLVIMTVLDPGEDPTPIVNVPPVDPPLTNPLDEPVEVPVKQPAKIPTEVVDIPPKKEPVKVPEPEPEPEPEPVTEWSDAKLADALGEHSKKYARAGNSGSANSQVGFFADEIKYFGELRSKAAASDEVENHQRLWPQRTFVPEKPVVTLSAGRRTAEVRMWMTYESANSEKITSGRILSFLKWDLSDLPTVQLIEQHQLARENSKTRFKDGTPWVGGADNAAIRESVKQMALAYYRAGNPGSSQHQIAFFGPDAYYFEDKYKKSHDVILDEINSYNRRWDSRRITPEEPVVVNLDGERRRATVLTWFEVNNRNSEKISTGRARGELKIEWTKSGRAGISSAKTADAGTLRTRLR